VTPDASRLIEQLDLLPHPEGGYYRETYRATQTVSVGHCGSALERSASTAIYFLLADGQFSALHRIRSDEAWHFYAGSPLRVITLAPNGAREDFLLGSNLTQGHTYQAIVPAGRWFGAMLVDPSSYCLVGCTVAPGFEFTEFELGSREGLLTQFPTHHDVICALTIVK
jgi:predicted cupin superfamily sugar epimerase